MDRKNLKIIEKLFRHLADNNKVETKQLLKQFQLSKENLQSYLNALHKIGLDISHDSQHVQIKHKIEYVDSDELNRLSQSPKAINSCFTTQSTNYLAKQDKLIGIYLAEHQSTGHGRQEKHWLSPLGQSISLSISHKFIFGLEHLIGLNIAIGVAIINAAKICGNKDLGLKWPNDIITRKGKVGGILIEATGNTQTSKVTIGIGINWCLRQLLLESIDQECHNINQIKCTKTKFIATLINQIEKNIKEFSINKLQNILPIWQQHDIYKNRKITVISQNGSYSATYIKVNKDGMLIVKNNNILKTLASGEVSIRY